MSKLKFVMFAGLFAGGWVFVRNIVTSYEWHEIMAGLFVLGVLVGTGLLFIYGATHRS